MKVQCFDRNFSILSACGNFLKKFKIFPSFSSPHLTSFPSVGQRRRKTIPPLSFLGPNRCRDHADRASQALFWSKRRSFLSNISVITGREANGFVNACEKILCFSCSTPSTINFLHFFPNNSSVCPLRLREFESEHKICPDFLFLLSCN